jgi:hypothetical protein
METTRRYPRSLSEAFPDVRASCIEGPRPWPMRDRLLFWGSVAFALASLAYRWL